ncbi:MAG: hypothetical protein M3Q68_07870, partial [Actinomycetota bacterium]|nr:hypothetical protein [Actinomycetota bacterium]
VRGRRGPRGPSQIRRLAHPERRRVLTLAVVAAHTATVALLATSVDASATHRGAELAALAASGAGYFVLRRVTERLADETDESLDERQASVRNHAYFIAYRLLGLGVTAILLAAFVAVDGFEVRLASQDLTRSSGP